MAMEARMSWQHMEHCWMEEKWPRSLPAQFSREERRPARLCTMQQAFIVWCRSGTIVKISLKPKTKEKWFLLKTKGGEKHRAE